jgi:tetratricopeptide (TPR) repeat protein
VSEDGELAQGREAAGRLAWADAYTALSLADGSSPLAAEDLELLAAAAHLLGRVEECLRALQRAQQLHAEAGESRLAARCAFWLAFHLGARGEPAQAGGWLARANRLLEHEPQDCAERGYRLLPLAVQHIEADDNTAAQQVSAQAAAIGRCAGDADLVALALHVQGRALVRSGRVGEAMAAFDEAMVAVITSEVSSRGRHGLLLDAGGLPRDPGVAARPRVDRGTDDLVWQAAGHGHLLR